MNTYLTSIYVYNNYVDQHFEIDFSPKEGEKFRHLIITGKNGTGKTVLLQALNEELFLAKNGLPSPPQYYNLEKTEQETDFKEKNTFDQPKVEVNFLEMPDNQQEKLLYIYLPTVQYTSIHPPVKSPEAIDFKKLFEEENNFNQNKNLINKKIKSIKNNIIAHKTNSSIYENTIKSSKKAIQIENAKIKITEYEQKIATLEKEIETIQKTKLPIPKISLAPYFLQFLLNLKKEHAYSISDGETEIAEKLKQRLDQLEKTFQYLFELPDLKLKHSFRRGTFRFELPDGRSFDFHQLSHGHNAILRIIAEIFLQIEAHRVDFPNEVSPSGIVVIDEIANHLHPSLQEKVLPTLTKLFPNLQFIIATHSPIVLASIPNPTIYDLLEHMSIDHNLMGIPYNVVMEQYFGITEYSLYVTNRLKRAKELLKNQLRNEEEQAELKAIGNELSRMSSPLASIILLEFEREKRGIPNKVPRNR